MITMFFTQNVLPKLPKSGRGDKVDRAKLMKEKNMKVKNK